MLNGLDLFSGYGGISLALREWVYPLAYCEIERYAQGILLSRMADGRLFRAPIWDDVTTFPGPLFRNSIDIIYGGFPCQDISVAGLGKGLEGERSGLVVEVFRLIREIEPTFVFLENVPAIRTRGAERVVKELAALGYDCRWDCLSAFDVGAPHKRERWFLLAYTKRQLLRDEQGRSRRASWQGPAEPGNDGKTQSVADAKCTTGGPVDTPRRNMGRDDDGVYVRRQEVTGGTSVSGPEGDAWSIEPDVGRVAHGVTCRVDRLRALGNGVVPQQVKEAFERLMGLK